MPRSSSRPTNLLHVVTKMVETGNVQKAHRSRLAGEGFKPPKGALVKNQGIERLGKAYPRDLQVRLKETNENESLMKCRELGHTLNCSEDDCYNGRGSTTNVAGQG